MVTERVETLIVGGGAVGSAGAYHLARRGQRARLVEQFAIGHQRGSSHGLARITRHSYAEEPHARLMIEAFAGWRALEAEAAEPLMIRTGGVSVSPAGVDYADRVAASLEAIGVPHRRLSGAELNRRLPQFGIPDDATAIFEPDAGLLRASRIVQVQIELAKDHGAVVQESCPIARIDLDGTYPVAIGEGFRIEAERLIVAAGGWVSRLLPAFADHLRPTRQQVLYLRPESDDFAIGTFPVWIYKGPGDLDAFYGMPEFLGGGVKAARHGGPNFDPDQSDPSIEPGYETIVRRFLAGFLPSLAEAPLCRSEICVYTVSPDELFVVGPLPGRLDVLVASPCSGHGFKFSNLVGRVLADLAIDGETDLPIGFWSPNRLFTKAPSVLAS